MLKSAVAALAATALAGLAQAQDTGAAEEELTVIHAGWLLAVPASARCAISRCSSAASASSRWRRAS